MLEVELKDLEKDYRSDEAYKMLRTNIEFSGEKNKVLVFTSCTPGEGKSTVSLSVAESLAQSGKKVLFVDADLRKSVLAGRHGVHGELKGLSHFLSGKEKVEDVVCKTQIENLMMIFAGIVPPNPAELLGQEKFEGLITSGRKVYDYIIIDCPPSLNMLTINALTAATSVLVPIQCEYYALEGLSQLIHTIDLVKDRLNNDLEIEGVVFTMYDARTNLSLQVVENVKENLQQNIYKTIIPRNVRLAEAPSYGQPITLYDPRSTGAEAYRLLAEEVINREVE